jgi:hypothetical protein
VLVKAGSEGVEREVSDVEALSRQDSTSASSSVILTGGLDGIFRGGELTAVYFHGAWRLPRPIATLPSPIATLFGITAHTALGQR